MNLTEENYGDSPFMLKFNNSINEETDTDSLKSEDNNMSVAQDSPSSKDVLTRLDSLLSGNDVTSDESDATQSVSVSDIFAKISRDKRKPEKAGRLPLNRNLSKEWILFSSLKSVNYSRSFYYTIIE